MKNILIKLNLPIALATIAAVGACAWNQVVQRQRAHVISDTRTGYLELERGLAITKVLLREAKAELEARTESPLAPVAPRSAIGGESAPAPRSEFDEARFGELMERVEGLELRLALSQHDPESAIESDDDSPRRGLVESELGRDSAREYQHLFLDPSAPWEQRKSALRMLRRFPDSMNVVSNDVKDTALGIMQTSGDPNQIKQTIKAIEGLPDPRFKSEYMRFARSSSDRRLRSEAIEALAQYKGEPDVQQLLAGLMHGEAPMEIRHEAEKALR